MGLMKRAAASLPRITPEGGPGGMYRLPGEGWTWAGTGLRPEYRWEHAHLSPYVGADGRSLPRVAVPVPVPAPQPEPESVLTQGSLF